jgi:branched-chain amino acid transport system substrate-binding protein
LSSWASAAPLTGTQSHLGKDIENGVRLAIEEYNAKGVTLGGKKVKFDVMAEDDQADPQDRHHRGPAAGGCRREGGDRAPQLGRLDSGLAHLQRGGIPQVSPASTNPKLTQQNFKATFRTIANDVQQGLGIGKYATTSGQEVAMIDDRTAYGQGLADEVEKAVKANGGSLTGREFTSDKATDFRHPHQASRPRTPT